MFRGQSSFKSRDSDAVGQDLAAGLAAGAVVRLVVGVADSLNRRAADRARLVETAVDGHLGSKRRNLLGERLAGLGAKAVDPLRENLAHRQEKPLETSSDVIRCDNASGDSRARWRISSEYALPMPLKRRGSVRTRLSVWFAIRRLVVNASSEQSRTSRPPGSCAAQALPAADEEQGRAVLRAGLGQDQAAVREVEGRQRALARELRAGAFPVEAAGDHEMEDQPEIVVEPDRDPLADPLKLADRLAESRVDRRVVRP